MHAPLIATQIKYRSRARAKLPTWAEAGCLFTARAFEQATSEATASLKSVWAGKTCLDLTTGLGVDSWHFSRAFDRVVSIEPDELLVRLAAFNLGELGVSNVAVQNTTAEAFIREYEGPPFDLVYVDPDRRDEAGKRKYGLADGRPDILALAPALLSIGRTVLIKASPMCDLTEGTRQLPGVRRAIVLADSTECKEVLFELEPGTGSGMHPVREVRFLHGGERHMFRDSGVHTQEDLEPHSNYIAGASAHLPLLESAPDSGWLLEPNVSIYKSDLVEAYFAEACPFPGARVTGSRGYLWTPERPSSFPGKAFRIEAAFSYKPGPLRAALRKRGVTSAHFTRKNFDLRLEDVRRALKLPEGGDRFLVLTRLRDGERFAFLARLA